MLITNYSDEDNEAEDDKKERERVITIALIATTTVSTRLLT